MNRINKTDLFGFLCNLTYNLQLSNMFKNEKNGDRTKTNFERRKLNKKIKPARF